jgi:DNA repair protein RadC
MKKKLDVDIKLLSIQEQDQVLKVAEQIAVNRLYRIKDITSPGEARDYIKSIYQGLEEEHFGVVFLDNKHRVIRVEHSLFRGTIDSASVYPRVVVKEALRCNAAAVIFVHNHPSGNNEPSAADRAITAKLKAALALVDIRTLDHLIVGGDSVLSFAEIGII